MKCTGHKVLERLNERILGLQFSMNGGKRDSEGCNDGAWVALVLMTKKETMTSVKEVTRILNLFGPSLRYDVVDLPPYCEFWSPYASL
jgi:hypothetical protein